MHHPKFIVIKIIFSLIIALSWWSTSCVAQNLKLQLRSKTAMGGKAFAASISDSSLRLEQREKIIFEEIKNGNVPEFLRTFQKINSISKEKVDGKSIAITYFVLPDYFAIGSNDDFFYVPMTPILAQRVANLLKCSLPTKKMVDSIYEKATIKLMPKPIPPTKAMITVPVFIVHNDTLQKQLLPYFNRHSKGELTAGNKKDIVLSNKIYTEKTAKVVIYGWHQLNGKAIQPLYNKHTNLWADYSHGIRFVLQKVIIHHGQKNVKTSLAKVLAGKLNILLSDEGKIEKPFYPVTTYKPY